jgi:predicted esterase
LFTFIWIHGLGETPQGFKEVFTDDRLCKLPASCKVILPMAPVREVTANGSEEMYCWFDIKNFRSRPERDITDMFLDEKYD